MKLLIPLLVLIFSFLLLPDRASAQQSVAAVHREGVALYEAGKYAEALEKFELVLKHSPSYVYARVYANKCKLAIKQNPGRSNDIEGTLSRVMIPTVDFQSVPLGDVLTYVRQRTEELTAGKVTPNIIFNGSPQERDSATITMKMNGVPVTTLLKYVATQARCQVRYEQHAILVTPYKNVPQETLPAEKEEKPNPFSTPAPNPFQ